MANENYPSFDPAKIAQSIEAAQRHSDQLKAKRTGGGLALDDGSLKLGGGCVDVTVNNGQACVNLPSPFGSMCLPIPSWIPSGQVAQACISICTKWGIPCGVEVTESVGGVVIVQQGVGCSC